MLQFSAQETLTAEDVKTIGKLGGTIAYASQGKKDCEEAVHYWQGGFSSFGFAPPPAFKMPTSSSPAEAPYDTKRAISFLSLFNPKAGANVECVFVNCTPKTPTDGVDVNGDPGGTESKMVTMRHSSSTAYSAASGLVCLSHPTALEDKKKPYT